MIDQEIRDIIRIESEKVIITTTENGKRFNEIGYILNYNPDQPSPDGGTEQAAYVFIRTGVTRIVPIKDITKV